MPLSARNGGVRWPQTKTFVCHVLPACRMFMVFGILWIISVNGSGCMFGLYSNEIKSSLGVLSRSATAGALCNHIRTVWSETLLYNVQRRLDFKSGLVVHIQRESYRETRKQMGDFGLTMKAGEELNCTGRSFCRSDIYKKFRGEVMEAETGEGAGGVDGKAIAAVGTMENSDLADSR
ncbi:hypothetical protein SLEP1_g53292 [Rubroshorea leprosula]|uniref:Uncharacterized protein n=1 Tax=Rubroshorea leprosula TaxID=152421 RepID=A0AAV5MBT4_9ROSI|nr:hypothetical protein SLEP1_g53292 [Rubroshorea leprosula]